LVVRRLQLRHGFHFFDLRLISDAELETTEVGTLGNRITCCNQICSSND
jgi:hypothetical protein